MRFKYRKIRLYELEYMGKRVTLINWPCDGQKERYVIDHIKTTLRYAQEDEIVLFLVCIFSYLHPFCLVMTWAVILFLLMSVFEKIIKKGKISVYECIVGGLFASYLSLVFQTALSSREPGSRTDVSLTLFETWTSDAQGRAYVIENVFFFIPFGILLCMCLTRLRKHRLYMVPLIGLVFSLMIEILQWMTERGYFQVDDIWTNTLGTMVGVGLYYFIFYNLIKYKRINW